MRTISDIVPDLGRVPELMKSKGGRCVRERGMKGDRGTWGWLISALVSQDTGAHILPKYHHSSENSLPNTGYVPGWG